MSDVVVSYKKEDKRRVSGIAEKLRALRVATWFDEDLPNGKLYDEAIAEEIASCLCVLVCWTPAAVASGYVRSEAMVGYNDGKLAACTLEPTPELATKPPFNIVQFSDLSDWKGQDNHAGWRKLVERIGVLTNRLGLAEYVDLLGQGDVKPTELASWKARFPTDPLAQADWSHTRARARKARKTVASNRKKSSPNVWAIGLVFVILAAAGFGGWWFYGLPSGWERRLSQYDTAGVDTPIVAAHTSAMDSACQAAGADFFAAFGAQFKTRCSGAGKATEATEDARKAEQFVKAAGRPAPDSARRFCGPGGATDVALQADNPVTWAYAVIHCTNNVSFRGLLNFETGQGRGVYEVRKPAPAGSDPAKQDLTLSYSGEFDHFQREGLGIGDDRIRGLAFAGKWRNGCGEGDGVFVDGGHAVYSGEVHQHHYFGNGIEWSRPGQFVSPAGAARHTGGFKDPPSGINCERLD